MAVIQLMLRLWLTTSWLHGYCCHLCCAVSNQNFIKNSVDQ
jgi:hypothetical protein